MPEEILQKSAGRRSFYAGQAKAKMINKRPVFIMAFAYGGSNILLNLLRSHPDLCSPRGELNEVFKGKLDEPKVIRVAKCLSYLPCLVAEGYDPFRFNAWESRAPLREFTRRQVDRILFREKLQARDASQNLYKAEGVKYTLEEIAAARLLCKCLDGLLFLSKEFSRMYPDAAFIALVRNGFAVCEGHVRRGYDLETIARHYELGCQKIIIDGASLPNYHIFRYEDILANPLEMLKRIYEAAGLDISKVEKVRLETKKVMGGDGNHKYVRNACKKELVWYPLDEIGKHFVPEANKNQIKRLTADQKEAIVRHCQYSLKHFGYL